MIHASFTACIDITVMGLITWCGLELSLSHALITSWLTYFEVFSLMLSVLLPHCSSSWSQTCSPFLHCCYLKLLLNHPVGSQEPAAIAHHRTITKISSLIRQGGMIEHILWLLILIMADLLETQDLTSKLLLHLLCLKCTFLVHIDLRKIICLQWTFLHPTLL